MDTLFFWLSKLVGMLLLPDAVLLLLLVACCVLLYRNQLRVARLLLTALLVLLGVLSLLPLGKWMYAPLENRFAANPPLLNRVDGIIMLGGDLIPQLSAYWQQPELSASAEREFAFATLGRQYPNAKLVMTGGSASLVDNEYREADFVPLLLQQLQIDPSRVIFERNSRNTYENAVNSKALVQPQAGEVWILVTSAGHMPRSVGAFCKQGWPVLPWPVDHMTAPTELDIGFDLLGHVQDLRTALHEWLGLTAYYATGKTTALFPTQCTP
ncbi:MAG: YdcF family protein [Pseudomonadota bacterium]